MTGGTESGQTGELIGGLTPLAGGHSGETFLGPGPEGDVVVRIYAGRSAHRGEHAVDIDAAVLRLVRGLLPVPEVLEVRRPDAGADIPAILVTSLLPGQGLDLVLAGAGEDLQRHIGARLGDLLTRLNRMPFLRTGPFVDSDLRVGSFGPGPGDLRDFVEDLVPGSPLAAWNGDDLAAVLDLADHAQDLLDPITRHCLVHSDFNPKNLLVDPVSGDVTGLLDWEFAHAGNPATDLGNLLRFDRNPAFLEAVLGSTSIDAVEGDLLTLARAADLRALVDLATRAAGNPVVERAHDRLLVLARAGDLHATGPA